MKLASLTFLAILVLAHLAGDLAESVALPLSMFRDGAYRPLGCLLFVLLLGIAALMLATLHRAGLYGSAALLGMVALFLLLVAVTPSTDGFHVFCSFVVLALLFSYYAVMLRGVGLVWMWAHLTVPLVLVVATHCHSYGLWQKSLIVYFLLAVNVQHFLLSRRRPHRGSARQGRRLAGTRSVRRRVVYVLEPGRSWARSRPADTRR
jgi:hypothetical protein